MTQRFYSALADFVLVIHFGFVAFVVLGLLAIWIGGWLRWNFIRNFWFRLTHLAAIGIVVAESVAGFVCPLTTWENQLRVAAGGEHYDESFIQHWLQRAMFFDFGPRVFTVSYIVFFLAVALSFWLVPPVWPHRRAQSTPRPQ